MTERLSALLHAEADVLDVPPPGHRRHRRLRPTTWSGVGAGSGPSAEFCRRRQRWSSPGSRSPTCATPAVARTSRRPRRPSSTAGRSPSGSTVLLGNGRTVRGGRQGQVGLLHLRRGAGAQRRGLEHGRARLDVRARGRRRRRHGLQPRARRPGPRDGSRSALPGVRRRHRPSATSGTSSSATCAPARWRRRSRSAGRSPGAVGWRRRSRSPGRTSTSGMDDATLDVDLTSGTVTESATLPDSTMPSVAGGREVVEAPRAQRWLLGRRRRHRRGPAPGRGPGPVRHAGSRGPARDRRVVADLHRRSSALTTTPPRRSSTWLPGPAWRSTSPRRRTAGHPAETCCGSTATRSTCATPATNECFSTPVEVDGRDLKLGGNSYEA